MEAFAEKMQPAAAGRVLAGVTYRPSVFAITSSQRWSPSGSA